MYDNYNYPMGADNEFAPWNQSEIPEKEFNVLCSQTLSKSTPIWTDNYIPGASGVDYEPDMDGGYCAYGWQEDDDTSDTNWAEEYKNDHYTPLELINKFKEYLVKLKDTEEANDAETKQKKREIKHLIEECSDWTEDETEYVEDK